MINRINKIRVLHVANDCSAKQGNTNTRHQ